MRQRIKEIRKVSIRLMLPHFDTAYTDFHVIDLWYKIEHSRFISIYLEILWIQISVFRYYKKR